MSTSKGDQTPEFTESGKRPFIATFVKIPEYCVGDKVYLLKPDGTRAGPYVVASVPSADKYILNLENGAAVNNGEEVEADDLEAEQSSS